MQQGGEVWQQQHAVRRGGVEAAEDTDEEWCDSKERRCGSSSMQ
jgi:hypothetical protein